MDYDTSKHSFCDRCEERVDLDMGPYQVVDGLNIFVEGYYGVFTDTLPDEVPLRVVLCHACCVWLAKEIAPVAEFVKGGHPPPDDGWCCEYAYRWPGDG